MNLLNIKSLRCKLITYHCFFYIIGSYNCNRGTNKNIEPDTSSSDQEVQSELRDIFASQEVEKIEIKRVLSLVEDELEIWLPSSVLDLMDLETTLEIDNNDMSTSEKDKIGLDAVNVYIGPFSNRDSIGDTFSQYIVTIEKKIYIRFEISRKNISYMQDESFGLTNHSKAMQKILSNKFVDDNFVGDLDAILKMKKNRLELSDGKNLKSVDSVSLKPNSIKYRFKNIFGKFRLKKNSDAIIVSPPSKYLLTGKNHQLHEVTEELFTKNFEFLSRMNDMKLFYPHAAQLAKYHKMPKIEKILKEMNEINSSLIRQGSDWLSYLPSKSTLTIPQAKRFFSRSDDFVELLGKHAILQAQYSKILQNYRKNKKYSNFFSSLNAYQKVFPGNDKLSNRYFESRLIEPLQFSARQGLYAKEMQKQLTKKYQVEEAVDFFPNMMIKMNDINKRMPKL